MAHLHYVDSDDDLRRHCLDDVARPLTCHVVFVPLKRCVFALSLLSVRPRRSVHFAGDVDLLLLGRDTPFSSFSTIFTQSLLQYFILKVHF